MYVYIYIYKYIYIYIRARVTYVDTHAKTIKGINIISFALGNHVRRLAPDSNPRSSQVDGPPTSPTWLHEAGPGAWQDRGDTSCTCSSDSCCAFLGGLPPPTKSRLSDSSSLEQMWPHEVYHGASRSKPQTSQPFLALLCTVGSVRLCPKGTSLAGFYTTSVSGSTRHEDW